MRGGPGPFGYIDMGGMCTVRKVRERLAGNERRTWYSHPNGTVAGPADEARMRADGIVVPAAGR
jgi:hypothetical protein